MWNYISGNRLLDQRSKKEAHRRHLLALQSIRSKIDNNSPLECTFLYTRPKARLQKYYEEKEINDRNCLLVDRMMRSSSYIRPNDRILDKSSLNSIYRNKVQRQINDSNSKLVVKLSSVESSYKQASWVKSMKEYQGYKSNLACSRKAPVYDLEVSSSAKLRPVSAKP